MTTITAINNLEEQGLLKVLVQSGLISTKTIFYREIFLLVEHKIQNGTPKMEAYTFFSDHYGIHEQTVMNACRTMKKEL